MNILYKLDDQGGFTTADTDTGRTCYAYPTSYHAEQAKTNPQDTARYMMQAENALGAWRDTNLGHLAQDKERIADLSA